MNAKFVLRSIWETDLGFDWVIRLIKFSVFIGFSLVLRFSFCFVLPFLSCTLSTISGSVEKTSRDAMSV